MEPEFLRQMILSLPRVKIHQIVRVARISLAKFWDIVWHNYQECPRATVMRGTSCIAQGANQVRISHADAYKEDVGIAKSLCNNLAHAWAVFQEVRFAEDQFTHWGLTSHDHSVHVQDRGRRRFFTL